MINKIEKKKIVTMFSYDHYYPLLQALLLSPKVHAGPDLFRSFRILLACSLFLLSFPKSDKSIHDKDALRHFQIQFRQFQKPNASLLALRCLLDRQRLGRNIFGTFEAREETKYQKRDLILDTQVGISDQMGPGEI